MKLFFIKKGTIINKYGFISIKHILLTVLLVYIMWLINIFYYSIIEIDQMYSDSYDKILDEKQKISEIINLKNYKEINDYEYKLGINEILGN